MQPGSSATWNLTLDEQQALTSLKEAKGFLFDRFEVMNLCQRRHRNLVCAQGGFFLASALARLRTLSSFRTYSRGIQVPTQRDQDALDALLSPTMASTLELSLCMVDSGINAM